MKSAGRPFNKIFKFDPYCPNYKTHEQTIRAKFKVPKIIGVPLKLPQLLSRNQKIMSAADKFGIYMLVLFKPWDCETRVPEGELNYDGFVDFMRKKSESHLPEDRSIVRIIHNTTYGLTPNFRNKQAMSMYRNRMLLPWSKVREEMELRKQNQDVRPVEIGDDMTADELNQQLLEDTPLTEDANLIIETINAVAGRDADDISKLKKARINDYINHANTVLTHLIAQDDESSTPLAASTFNIQNRLPGTAEREAFIENHVFSDDINREIYSTALVNIKIDQLDVAIAPLLTEEEKVILQQQQAAELTAWTNREH